VSPFCVDGVDPPGVSSGLLPPEEGGVFCCGTGGFCSGGFTTGFGGAGGSVTISTGTGGSMAGLLRWNPSSIVVMTPRWSSSAARIATPQRHLKSRSGGGGAKGTRSAWNERAAFSGDKLGAEESKIAMS
jgi:hypothetical protein